MIMIKDSQTVRSSGAIKWSFSVNQVLPVESFQYHLSPLGT